MAAGRERKTTDEENAQWIDLCTYVHDKILGYDESQKITRKMALRLRGLSQGKFMANNNIKATAKYPYDVILYTFKYCYSDIQRALRSVNFKDESHKFNYIMKIVEDNINTVYIRMKTAKKNEEEVEKMNMDISTNSDFTSIYENRKSNVDKKEPKRSNKLADLW